MEKILLKLLLNLKNLLRNLLIEIYFLLKLFNYIIFDSILRKNFL
jgi:hypothetical protein